MSTLELRREDGIAIVLMDCQVTNAFNPALVDDLAAVVAEAAGDAAIRGLVLTSSNEKFFSIGLALPELIDLSRDEYRIFHSALNRLCLQLYTLPKPTVAAVSGHAIAGGCVVALCCDCRFIAAGRKLMGLNEIKLGVPVPYVADCVLRATVGSRWARMVAESGEFYPPAELERIGLVDRILPPDDLLPEAIAWARGLGGMPASAYALIKRNRTEPVVREIEAGLTEREELFVDCWFAEDTRARMRRALETFQR